MKKILLSAALVLSALIIYGTKSYLFATNYPEDKMYFCTAADERYFTHLLNLIGSIHRLHLQDTHEIAVFDLGFKPEQRAYLASVEKVNVYDVEKTHPDLLKRIECRPGKFTRGWYAWKPVCIKQALDKFPFVLWLDAGTTVISSLEPIFEYTKKHGVFLTDCGHNIHVMTTQRVIDEFKLNTPERSWILNEETQGTAAGVIGVSRKHYNDLIYPWYKLTYNMDLFVDDGTAAGGPEMGRYEQTLLSIYAQLLNLPVFKKDFNVAQDNRDHNYDYISIDDKTIKMHITEIPRQVHKDTTIFCSRNFMPWLNKFTSSIAFKQTGAAHEAVA